MTPENAAQAARDAASVRAQKRRRCDQWMVRMCLLTSLFESFAGRPGTAVILGAVTYWGSRTDGQ